MDALKKQASKLREQVAKQQQAVFRQFSSRFAVDPALLDEPDAESCHQIRTLYKSTKGAKHFQQDILRRLRGLKTASSRQTEIASKLADGCVKYGGSEFCDELLGKTSLKVGSSLRSIEAEREKLLQILGGQVYEPLQTMVMSAPLEDARHLAHCYEKLKQDVEAQAVDVARRQMRSKEGGGHADSMVKLQHSEHRLSELRRALSALGRETISAMETVSADQRRLTFQQLLLMVDAERSYHHNVASILDQLHDEMIVERQKMESKGQIEPIASAEECSEIEGDGRNSSHPQEALAISSPHKDINHKVEFEKSNNITEGLINRTEKEQPSNLRRDYTAVTQIQSADGFHSTGENPSITGLEADKDEIELRQTVSNGRDDEKDEFFIAEVIHPFDAQGDGELSLSMGDFIVVRQESETGWSEGECMGKAGWFPTAYVEQRDRAPVGGLMPSVSSAMIQSPPPPSASSSPSSSFEEAAQR
ncbi:SH3 domain-containing protein 2-like [Wolffia australiana]